MQYIKKDPPRRVPNTIFFLKCMLKVKLNMPDLWWRALGYKEWQLARMAV